MRVSHFIMIILLLIPVVQASDQTYSFKMENNSGLSFDNGTFLIEVVELLPSYYAKVNMTSWGTSKFYNLWEGEPIKYDRVTVNSSFITPKDARITVVFPEAWGYPKTYKIEPLVVPVGIPNLVITKSADKTSINPGDVVSFTIKVENTGNATAYNLSLTERLPTGFTVAAGSRFPPAIQDKLDTDASLELYYALKAVDPGSYTLEPAAINYGSKTNKSGQITITVAEVTQEKSNLSTVISIDRTNVYTDDLIKADIRITNTGKAHAKSVLIDGTPPLGTTSVEGDFRQVYDAIAPGEVKENRVILKAQEGGNYTINLRTVYNDDPIGSPTNSERITVTRKDGIQLYIILPIILIILGVVILTIKRHKEYSY